MHFFRKVSTMPAVTDTSRPRSSPDRRPTRSIKTLIKLATASSLAGALLVTAGCSKPEPVAPTIRPALAYKIPAGSGTESEVYAGEIRARVESDHAFRVGGKVAQRLVDSGAVVKKGQPLARLDPQDVRLAAESARAQVAAQQTESDFADAELKRFRDLFAKGFVSQSALDQKINLAGAAKARLAAQRAQSNVTANQASYATLFAETDGVVTQVMAEAGQVVAAGQAVMKIANPRDKELSISVPEVKLPEFKAAIKDAANQKLNVALWAQPKVYYPAVIREISGAADNVTRTYAVRLALEKPDDAVQLGMTAYAVFGSANEAGTMSVPLSAVYIKGNVTGVWQIAADGSVSLKPVTVLQYRETSAFIRAEPTSVKPGDIIVAAGVHKLRPGEIVKPITDATVTGDGKVAFAPIAPSNTPAENATATVAQSR
jgi:membrane fusion protein, multidrug efflux system